MYYPIQQLIITDTYIIDLKTGLKYELVLQKGKIFKTLGYSPAPITHQDIQMAEQQNIKIRTSGYHELSDAELSARRTEISKFLISQGKARKVIFTFV